jgi:alkanesulfonate monooxygenase SsuD/methylene tetrahydromethanopterin reductase-like flavin-dependent oxidoreductase (luciferase family)
VGQSIELGVTPWRLDDDGSADTLAEQAALAEALGFHSFWLPESHFTGPAAIPAPLLRLAAVAARTQRLKIGTTSYLLPVRHPIHVAEEVAVLDRLSGGRVILGVGRGFRSALFSVFEVPVKEKRDRFEAALAVMRKAWSGDPVSWESNGDGESTPVTVSPQPVQQPHPPIWVAGFGPKAVAQAGRLGLPYLASPIESFERLGENYRRHREALPGECDPADLAVPIMRTIFVSRDAALLKRVRDGLQQQAAGLAKAQVASIRRAAGASLEDWAVVGGPDEVVDRVAAYRSELGVTHLIARGPVPEASPEEIAESLAELAALDL